MKRRTLTDETGADFELAAVVKRCAVPTHNHFIATVECYRGEELLSTAVVMDKAGDGPVEYATSDAAMKEAEEALELWLNHIREQAHAQGFKALAAFPGGKSGTVH